MSNGSSTVLVTGGCGFIGSNLCNRLVEGGNTVIALDDLSLGIESNINPEVEFVKGSVLDTRLVEELVREVDFVFHQAAKSSSPMFKGDPRLGIDVNVNGFMNVMQGVKQTNKDIKVVYASSSSIYNGLASPFSEMQTISPKTFYETSFYTRELIARSYFLEYGVKSIGLRYFSVYGKNEKHKGIYANNISQFLWDMKKGNRPIIYGDGNQTRDFTNVDDVVNANILAAAGHVNFGVYNVGTGKNYTFNDVIRFLNAELKTEIKPNYIPNPVSNYVQETLSDPSLARQDLGFTAQVTLEEGIKNLVYSS